MVHGDLKQLRCFPLWHHAWQSGQGQELWPHQLYGCLSMHDSGTISYLPSSAFKMTQVNKKTFSMRKLVVYRI